MTNFLFIVTKPSEASPGLEACIFIIPSPGHEAVMSRHRGAFRVETH